MENKQIVTNINFGADIEYFLQNKTTNEIISAEGLIQGTKDEPFSFDAENKWYATSLDNVMAEGCIPPAESPYEMWKSIEKLRKYIDSVVESKNLKTVALPSARLDYSQLMTPHSQQFGCAPSLNCWTGEEVYPQPKGDNCRASGK